MNTTTYFNPDGTVTAAVILVHGIYSSHETFGPLIEKLRHQEHIPTTTAFGFFDYDFKQSISTSGSQLAEKLIEISEKHPDIPISLVGHSMGGLVCRFALLKHGDQLSNVNRLIMLGTPNHGTLHTGRLGMLAHVSRDTVGMIWSISTKNTGIKELTEISDLFEAQCDDDPKSESRTHHVDYFTVPGLFYHEDRKLFRKRTPGSSFGLGALQTLFQVSELLPFWKANLTKPHDGIVEESSVYMGSDIASRFTERLSACAHVPKAGPYLHIIHRSHKDADHVMIHNTDTTAKIIAQILNSPNLETYRETLSKELAESSVYRLKP